MARMKVIGAGAIVGILWLIMAGTTIWSAVRGGMNGREDWALGWGLVGGLLLVAGIAAIVGSWWHETRVRTRRGNH